MSNFFPPRPKIEPKIYAYEDTNPQYAGLLKIGYTTNHELVHQASLRELPLFSDSGEEVFIPEPVKEYPPVHVLEVAHAYADGL